MSYVDEGDLLILQKHSNKSIINAIVSDVIYSDAEFLGGMRCNIAINMHTSTCHIFPQTDPATEKEELVVYIYPQHKSQNAGSLPVIQANGGHYNILQIIKGK